jgi:predicted NBD/HSP70 family sugar kinase
MHEDYDARAGMDGAVKLVDEALTRSGTEPDRVLGVGLGLPGPIHRSTGTVGSSAILPGWTDVRIAEVMSERLALPVHVDNDANLGALAELHWGAATGRRRSCT